MVKSALGWGRDVAEMWTGTLYEKQIEEEIARIELESAVGSLELAKTLANDLAEFLDQAEREYERSYALQKGR